MSNDQVIVDEIRATLDSDPRIHNAAELAVSETAGTVTLRGTVRSLHQRRTAVAIARSVRGVCAVEDEVRVDPRDQWKDEELRGAAPQALMSDDSVPADWLDVVIAAWVTLKGEVKHQSDSDAAFAAVSRLAGVGGSTNEIKVITAGLGG
jgi:osmotically-inducible protein OsmY